MPPKGKDKGKPKSAAYRRGSPSECVTKHGILKMRILDLGKRLDVIEEFLYSPVKLDSKESKEAVKDD